MFLLICIVSQLSMVAGFSLGRYTLTTSYGRQLLQMTAEEDERPRVQIKRIVESLSSGTKTGSEVEMELKAVELDGKLLDISTGVAGSLIGLVTGGLLDGALANGDAPWSAPVGFAILGGAAYYGAIQKKNAQVSEFLLSTLGQPVLKAGKSAAQTAQNYIEESKAATLKKVEDTIEDINAIPISIRDSIVTAKDDAISNIKAIPVNLQNSASKSYNEAKQNAINKVDQKVSELKAIPANFQEKSALAAKNAQLKAAQQAEALANDIKATPGRLLDAAVLKAEATAADISKIPQIAANKVVTAYETKKQEVTDAIDQNVKSVKSAVNSILPSDSSA